MSWLGQTRLTLRRLLSRRQSWFALFVISLFVVMALSAPVLSPPAENTDLPVGLKRVGRASGGVPRPPSDQARLGTTSEQYDVFHALLWGARNALRLGLSVAIVSAVIGTLVGGISGYVGGTVSSVAMRVTDAFLAFPAVLGVLVFSHLFTNTGVDWTVPPTPIPSILSDVGLNTIMVTLMAFMWMPYARMVNANLQQIKDSDYVIAARAVGASPRRILFRHLLPNVLPPIIVLMARDIGGVVILDAAFSFLKLDGMVEWGQLLASNRSWLVGVYGNPFTYWWVLLPFALALILFGVAWNMLGEGFNFALNPRARQ
jgi:peptide/nickel transport system permease protein